MADGRREFLAKVLSLTLLPYITAPPAQADGLLVPVQFHRGRRRRCWEERRWVRDRFGRRRSVWRTVCR
jgi:hypothetical protein